MHRGATAAQIKHDINSGCTGDKVPGFDPAAAPLGTDEEAGGAAYDPHLMASAREQELQGRPRVENPNAATPELQPNASAPRRNHLVVALITAVATAAGATLLFMML